MVLTSFEYGVLDSKKSIWFLIAFINNSKTYFSSYYYYYW